YDRQGKKIQPDLPTKCPHCQTSINKTEMDIVEEKSNSQETT
ncbi:15472_t:CDS:1, partial [Racocetra persica]